MGACDAPEARQFDFWIGDWHAECGDGHRGSNRIRSILDGCVILEEFDASQSAQLRGTSVSMWAPSRGRWLQTWVDNAGNYLALEGGLDDAGRMVLSTAREDDGREIIWRMVFADIAERSFDGSWERRGANDSEWEPVWRIHYTRR